MVSKYDLTLSNGNLLWVFNRVGFPSDAGHFKNIWSNGFFSGEVRSFLLFGAVCSCLLPVFFSCQFLFG